jgi:hypothetical protein
MTLSSYRKASTGGRTGKICRPPLRGAAHPLFRLYPGQAQSSQVKFNANLNQMKPK